MTRALDVSRSTYEHQAIEFRDGGPGWDRRVFLSPGGSKLPWAFKKTLLDPCLAATRKRWLKAMARVIVVGGWRG